MNIVRCLFSVSFYNSCLYLVSLSIISSVIVLTMSRSNHSNCLPWRIKQHLKGRVGYYLVLNYYINQVKQWKWNLLWNNKLYFQSSISSSQRVTVEEMRDHQVTDCDEILHREDYFVRPSSTSVKSSVQQDWILLAAAIDRVLFLLYSLVFFIMALVYTVQ